MLMGRCCLSSTDVVYIIKNDAIPILDSAVRRRSRIIFEFVKSFPFVEALGLRFGVQTLCFPTIGIISYPRPLSLLLTLSQLLQVKIINHLCLSAAGDNWSPNIQIVPEDQIIKEGTSARIDCVYQNADVMEWYFQETGPLDNSTR